MTRPELDQLAPTRTDNSLNRVYESHLCRQCRPQAHQGLVGRRLGRVVLPAEVGVDPGAVRQGHQGFHHHRHAEQRQSRRAGILQRQHHAGAGALHRLHADQRRQGLRRGHGVRFPAHPAERFWRAWAVHAHLEQGLCGRTPMSASSKGCRPTAHRSACSTRPGRSAPTSTGITTAPRLPRPSPRSRACRPTRAPSPGSPRRYPTKFFKGFKVYAEGKNLANAIARTYLANRQDAVWASGSTTTNGDSSSSGTSSAVGQGYTAYGRMFTLGVSYRF